MAVFLEAFVVRNQHDERIETGEPCNDEGVPDVNAARRQIPKAFVRVFLEGGGKPIKRQPAKGLASQSLGVFPFGSRPIPL
jgi:hypothetical protein